MIIGLWIAGLFAVNPVSIGMAAQNGVALETENYRIYLNNKEISRRGIERIARDCERARRRICDFLGLATDSAKIDYHIYPSFEAKGLATQDTRPSHVDTDRSSVYVVINDRVAGNDAMMDALLILRRHFDRPATRALETGVAVFLSEHWRGQGFEYWAVRLYASGNMPPLGELLHNKSFGRESYLVRQAAAGSFVAFVVNKFGKDALLQDYAVWTPGAPEVARLERGWHQYLDRIARRYERQIRDERARFPRPNRFQKGFCFAHEGYQIFNGYGSHKSDEAIEKLASLGTNAISLTPFSYMSQTTSPEYLRYSQGAGQENDEGIIHSASTAKTLGMSVMLKPHIWLHRSWPGAVDMQTEADWATFFDYYYHWIRHYALLAEMYQIDILCIGVELAKTTVGHEADWVNIIDRLRALYSGALTYAANWGDEFENVEFWDELDYIGINCYYPLSQQDEVTEAELENGARIVIDRIESIHDRFNKPVLFTEIGFTSTPTPWKEPHKSVRAATVNLEHQAMCYRAIFRALHGRTWCRGIYWWKWPSFVEYGGPRNRGFTPNGKPAENIVREWYLKR